MIRAIVFDCFGVLVSEQWLSFKQEYFGHDAALSQEAADVMQQADAGFLAHEEFVDRIAEMSGLSVAAVNQRLDQNVVNARLFTYITNELKPSYKIGMLSNAAADWLEELFTTEQLAIFDAITLSFESGVAKPDERAYYLMAERLGVEPEECLFIDDQERHCTGAREAGMTAVLFEGFDDFPPKLQTAIAK